MKRKPLNDKQLTFCRLVAEINELSEGQCYWKAYAESQGKPFNKQVHNPAAHKLLKREDIQAEVARCKEVVQKAADERSGLNTEFVIDQHLAVHNMSVRDILNDDWSVKPISEWPAVWCQFLSAVDISELSQAGDEGRDAVMAVMKKFKWPDKLKNLELMGKIAGAYVEKSEIDLKGVVTKVTYTVVDPKKS